MSASQEPLVANSVPKNGMGTAALIMGILQFFCLGTIGSILAIVFGRIGLKRVALGEATNGGSAKAGLVLGIIGVIFSVITLVVVIIIAITGGSTTT
jgi:hypothetical protein